MTATGNAPRLCARLAAVLCAMACTPQSKDPVLERPASAPSVAFGDFRPEGGREEESASLKAPVPGAVDSNLASVFNGGGCFPPAIDAQGLDQLILVDPEWAPVVRGSSVASEPVVVHGAVVDSHGDKGGDFPITHTSNDQNTFVQLDPADEGRLATGNGDGLFDLEWETGALPDWAWPSPGDRIVARGRWIFDCGHPNPRPGTCANSARPCLTLLDCGGAACNGTVFNYRSEMHPPEATAVLRPIRGDVLGGEDGERRAQATARADVFVSAFGGSAGDECVLTHRNSINELLGTNCYPLSRPAAHVNDSDFSFELPLPPRPRPSSMPSWRIDRRATPSLPGQVPVDAEVTVEPVLAGPVPHLVVTVRMAHGTPLPTGFAGTVVAGWQKPQHAELQHVRVTIEGVVVRDPLKAGAIPGHEAPGWRVQASVNGDWRSLSGLENVGPADAGAFFPQTRPLAFDLFLGKADALRIGADGVSSNCVDTLFGQSLGADLARFGFDVAKATACLNAVAEDLGTVSASFSWPRFGARKQAYETPSDGAGAFALRYRIDRVDDD
ncbi:MAG TPA: hypothetical protein VI356_04485 [Myxococcales bacterium]